MRRLRPLLLCLPLISFNYLPPGFLKNHCVFHQKLKTRGLLIIKLSTGYLITMSGTHSVKVTYDRSSSLRPSDKLCCNYITTILHPATSAGIKCIWLSEKNISGKAYGATATIGLKLAFHVLWPNLNELPWVILCPCMFNNLLTACLLTRSAPSLAAMDIRQF